MGLTNSTVVYDLALHLLTSLCVDILWYRLRKPALRVFLIPTQDGKQTLGENNVDLKNKLKAL